MQTLQADAPFARLLPFLEQLAQNNDRGWFEANRARYETDLRDPCLQAIADLQRPLARISPVLVADPRPSGGSLVRIHRDLRFTKDRSPYKTYASMRLHHRDDGVRSDAPGFYVRLAPGGSYVSAGVRDPPSASLARIRAAILGDTRGWRKVLACKPQWDTGPSARLPPGIPADHPFAQDLRRRSFVARIPLADDEVAGPGIVDTIARSCRLLAPLDAFLAKAVGVEW